MGPHPLALCKSKFTLGSCAHRRHPPSEHRGEWGTLFLGSSAKIKSTELRLKGGAPGSCSLMSHFIPAGTRLQDVSAERPSPASHAGARSGIPHFVQDCHRL